MVDVPGMNCKFCDTLFADGRFLEEIKRENHRLEEIEAYHSGETRLFPKIPMFLEEWDLRVEVDRSPKERGYVFERHATDLENSVRYGCSFCLLLMNRLEIVPKFQQPANCTDHGAENTLLKFRLWIDENIFSDRIDRITIEILDREYDYHNSYLTLKMFAAQDNPAASHIEGRYPDCDASSKHNLVNACKWSQNCKQNHTWCRRLEGSFLPTRVLDVGSEDGNLKLCEGAKIPQGEYVCLSYCWGHYRNRNEDQKQFMTTKATLIDNGKSIKWEKLPQIIKDAVTTTRRLEIRYLWVDALCIVQDGEADKAREIAQMGKIYQNASITISAASASGWYDGFLKNGKSMRQTHPTLPFRCQNGSIGEVSFVSAGSVDRYGIVGDDSWLQPELIHTRAWTLQEHVISPRLLIYSSAQLFWVCSQGHEKEGGQDRFGPYTRDSPLMQMHLLFSCRWEAEDNPEYRFDYAHAPDYVLRELQMGWETAMVEYSRRELFDKSDKLPALSGLASRFQPLIQQDEYLAGHWKKWLLPHLLWSCVNSDSVKSTPNCPSWSWLSMDGEITIETSLLDSCSETKPVAKIVSCTVRLQDKNAPYGAVKDGCLVISGNLKEVCPDWKKMQLGDRDPREGNSYWPHKTFFPAIFEPAPISQIKLDGSSVFQENKTAHSNPVNPEPGFPASVWCLPLLYGSTLEWGDTSKGNYRRSVQGIMLQKSHNYTFTRTGWFSCFVGGGIDWDLDNLKEEIVIV